MKAWGRFTYRSTRETPFAPTWPTTFHCETLRHILVKRASVLEPGAQFLGSEGRARVMNHPFYSSNPQSDPSDTSLSSEV